MRADRGDLRPLLWGVGITALLLLPLPTHDAARRWPALLRDLNDACHPLAFAWLAHLLFDRLRVRIPRPSRAPYLWVLGAASAYAAATELIQPLVGRQSSLMDAANDMLGAAVGLLLHVRGEQTLPWRRRGLAWLAATFAAVALAPLAFTIAAYAHRSLKSPVLWQPDSALFARFSHWQSRSSALVIREPLADWRDFRYLEIDISNPAPAMQRVAVRVHDLAHDLRHEDRYNTGFDLPPASRQTLRISLRQVSEAPRGRQMDMRAIRGIVIFSAARPRAAFVVHEIRLAR
jgi:VanZ family protein